MRSSKSKTQVNRRESRGYKSSDQVRELKKEFFKDPDWDPKKIRELAERLELSLSQVYKWKWDRLCRFKKNLERKLSRNEIPKQIFTVIKMRKEESSSLESQKDQEES